MHMSTVKILFDQLIWLFIQLLAHSMSISLMIFMQTSQSYSRYIHVIYELYGTLATKYVAIAIVDQDTLCIVT